MPPRKRNRAETASERAWKGFWNTTDGRVAIGQLFKDFGFYDTPSSVEATELARSIGQRDVLVRLAQLINLKPELAVEDMGHSEDILDRVLRSN